MTICSMICIGGCFPFLCMSDYISQTPLCIFTTHCSCQSGDIGEVFDFPFCSSVAPCVSGHRFEPVVCWWCQGAPISFSAVCGRCLEMFSGEHVPLWLQQKLLLVAVRFSPPVTIQDKGSGQAEHNRCSCCFCWHSKSTFSDVTDNFCVSWRDEIPISLNVSNGYESSILLCLIYGYALPWPVDHLGCNGFPLDVVETCYRCMFLPLIFLQKICTFWQTRQAFILGWEENRKGLCYCLY